MASVFELTASDIHAAIGHDVDIGLFRVSVDEHGPDLRVCWLPRNGGIGPPESPGTRGRNCYTPDAIGPVREVVNSMQLMVRAYLFAPDYEALEQLHADVLLASRGVMGTASVPGSFDILSERDENFGNILCGRSALVQEFAWKLAVVKRQKTIAAVTDQALETDLLSPCAPSPPERR